MNGKAILPGGNAQSLDNVAGQPIAEYTHMKSGTVHKLEGPEKAKYIVFKATGDYNDGDTWTLNNKPVTVTYNDGEELLPTAVLVNDMVEAVVMENQLRLMLQKPTPQPSISDNWCFEINQQTKKMYDNRGYTIDRWAIVGGYTKAEVVEDGIKIITTQPTTLNIFIQVIEIEKDLIGEDLAATVELGDSSNGVDARVQAYSSDNSYLSGSHKFVNSNSAETFHFIVPENTKRLQFIFRPAVYGQESFFVIKRAKLEKGRRFTGWQAWNHALELAKCQKYQLLTTENGSMHIRAASLSANSIFFDLPIPVTMRTTPVLTNPEAFVVRRFGSIDAESGFTFSALAHTGCVRIEASKKAHGLTDATLIVGKTILDANL